MHLLAHLRASICFSCDAHPTLGRKQVNILTMLCHKCGTGKSTLARSLAVAGLLDKRKVAIIDADPQGTVVAWGKRREHKVPHIVALGSSTIASQVDALKGRGANLVIIDTPAPRSTHHQYGSGSRYRLPDCYRSLP
jgi:hypothetical protein